MERSTNGAFITPTGWWHFHRDETDEVLLFYQYRILDYRLIYELFL